MFIWMTLVQSQHPAGLLSSQRRRGRPPGSRTCNSYKSHILQAFIQTSDVWGVPEWVNTFFAPKRCADPHHKGTPSSAVSVPNIQHPLAYLLPRSPFNDLHPHSPWAWPSMVTTFTLFSPFAQSRLAWNSQKHSRKWDIRQNILLIYSLPFRFRHSVVFYCRRSIFLYAFKIQLILEGLQSSHHENSFSFYSFLTGLWKYSGNVKWNDLVLIFAKIQ